MPTAFSLPGSGTENHSASAPQKTPSVHVRGTGYERGLTTGRAFKDLIQSRISADVTLQQALVPFYGTEEGRTLSEDLFRTNRNLYPDYFDEIRGTADGSEVPLDQVLLLNLRKELAPFLPDRKLRAAAMEADQCSDVLICSPELAVVGHNEDGDGATLGRSYLVHAELVSGTTFSAYTYAGELPSCAFGFNSHGIAFSLNAVPPATSEAVKGGVGRNFVSRDLLEASSLEDALARVQVRNLVGGHNYNIMDVINRRIVTVETASKGRFSVLEIGQNPYFHANLYRRLHLEQKRNESSIHRLARANELGPARTIDDICKVLSDNHDTDFPIFMTGNVYEEKGPSLYTLCTALFDLDRKEVVIYAGRASEKIVSDTFPLLSYLGNPENMEIYY